MTHRPETGPEPPTVPGGQVHGGRTYPGDDPAAHVRRLLRRAVNADRPGADALERLAGARAYAIERLPDPRGRSGGQDWIVLYEHAFLLGPRGPGDPAGAELCLYELEHDHTPDGGLVSEVYDDESAAARVARRLARPAPAGHPVPPDLGAWPPADPDSVDRDG
ncbi:DUF6227 family protein [Streptomyces marincola]|uniref:DUF6227 family protein n=1 Tax=Streptomyces marincola TaxID=2878388 RepID=UPI001CF1EDDB|nr:DUF6227 family protein [Streptomyces marincola]UCM90704.1 DUF6227 family protein [Streptomyces marincola]